MFRIHTEAKTACGEFFETAEYRCDSHNKREYKQLMLLNKRTKFERVVFFFSLQKVKKMRWRMRFVCPADAPKREIEGDFWIELPFPDSFKSQASMFAALLLARLEKLHFFQTGIDPVDFVQEHRMTTSFWRWRKEVIIAFDCDKDIYRGKKVVAYSPPRDLFSVLKLGYVPLGLAAVMLLGFRFWKTFLKRPLVEKSVAPPRVEEEKSIPVVPSGNFVDAFPKDTEKLQTLANKVRGLFKGSSKVQFLTNTTTQTFAIMPSGEARISARFTKPSADNIDIFVTGFHDQKLLLEVGRFIRDIWQLSSKCVVGMNSLTQASAKDPEGCERQNDHFTGVGLEWLRTYKAV